jgi:hypothetical protein
MVFANPIGAEELATRHQKSQASEGSLAALAFSP